MSTDVSIGSSRISEAPQKLEPAQIRAARALLDWRQEDLSKASGVGTATIQRIEKSDGPITGYVSTVMRIEAAFEKAGILFIADDEIAGIGLRLAKKKKGR
ncbi:MAG: helix-turn-helix transcriptional regulator [Xanthobacteraceae bacterium]